ncbi:MAG: glycosyltransferase, partial [Actinobacteria bacterium]|nr:glycosyltransferase [Actinomycetota bacterium]
RRLAERVGGTLAVEVHVRDHPPRRRAGLPAPRSAVAALPRVAAGRLRVGVIGQIGESKGFAHLLDLARHVQEHDIPVDVVVIGETQDDKALDVLPGVTVTGRYLDDHVDDLVRAARLDVIWFPGAGPETWSYVLDVVLDVVPDSGLPIVAFRIGAIAERLVAVPHATLLPIGDAFRPDRVIDALARAAGKASLSTTMQP